MHKKLKLIKGPIRIWNKHSFGDIIQILKLIEEDPHRLDSLGDTRELIEVELQQVTRAQDEASKWRIRKCQIFK